MGQETLAVRSALMRRRAIRLAIVLVAAGVSPACHHPTAPAASTPRFESAPCPTLVEPTPSADTWHCGYLVVPENRAAPNGKTIRLAIARVPAATPTPAPDPVVYLSGGPGEDAVQESNFVKAAGLNRDRELILVSQRGAYSSQPALTCTEIDQFHADHIAMVSDAPAVRTCHDRLAATGADLSSYNTTESAADIADLRKALGITQWNVYGLSYGSDLALTYMREHPEGIRAVTIDGAVPSDVVSPSWFWSSARESFDNVFGACGADATCRDHFPDLRNTFTGLVRQLEANPVEISVPVPDSDLSAKVVLSGAALVNWMMWMDSRHENASEVPYGIDQLAHGHPETVAAQWAASWAAAKYFGQLSYGLAFGATCSEWVPYDPPSRVLEQGRVAFPEFPDSVLSLPPPFPFGAEECQVWNAPKAPESVRMVTRSSIPTLVVNGQFDARTGAQWGDYVARQLTRPTVITIPGVGHAAAITSPCAQQVMASFFRNPDKADTSCVATVSPKPFKLS